MGLESSVGKRIGFGITWAATILALKYPLGRICTRYFCTAGRVRGAIQPFRTTSSLGGVDGSCVGALDWCLAQARCGT